MDYATQHNNQMAKINNIHSMSIYGRFQLLRHNHHNPMPFSISRDEFGFSKNIY